MAFLSSYGFPFRNNINIAENFTGGIFHESAYIFFCASSKVFDHASWILTRGTVAEVKVMIVMATMHTQALILCYCTCRRAAMPEVCQHCAIAAYLFALIQTVNL